MVTLRSSLNGSYELELEGLRTARSSRDCSLTKEADLAGLRSSEAATSRKLVRKSDWSRKKKCLTELQSVSSERKTYKTVYRRCGISSCSSSMSLRRVLLA